MSNPFELLQRRPDEGGKRGRPIKVRTNFFPISNFPKGTFYQYDIKFSPEVPKPICRQVFEQWRRQNATLLNGLTIVFDGMAIAFASQKIDFDKPWNFDVVLVDPGDRKREFKVALNKNAVPVHMNALEPFLMGKGSLPNMSPLQLIDVVIRYNISQKYCTVSRSFFTDEERKSLSGGAEVYQGYFQSARPTRGGMMVNLDVAATTFWETGMLAHVAAHVVGFQQAEHLRGKLNSALVKSMKSKLKNVKVLLKHFEHPRAVRIDKLSQNVASNEFFDIDGKKTSVEAYFKEKYNVKLRYPFLPCIVNAKGSIFPMEVCEVAPRQRYLFKLDSDQTTNMINFTTTRPNDRMNKIQKALSLLNWAKNPEMKKFGLEVKNTICEASARVLNTPKVIYRGNKTAEPRFGAWNMKGLNFWDTQQLESYFVVCFENLQDGDIRKFITDFVRGMSSCGIAVPNQKPVYSKINPATNFETQISQLASQLQKTVRRPLQLVVCFIPGNGNEPLYQRIKRHCETVLGVPSQCMALNKVRKGSPQYFANVALKVNSKLGGINSKVAFPFISEQPTMVMGIDVTHPAPGERLTRKSIAALVGSLDVNISRLVTATRAQDPRAETISDIQAMATELLKKFSEVNKRLPSRILVFRDGISEGQFQTSLEYELKGIKRALHELGGAQAKVTFIILQKRHHTRLFPVGDRDMDRSQNCLAGTVVDQHIVHPYLYDFYLLSHSGIQGTSRPTHYTVIHDENKLNSDMLQELTFSLCHAYVRCTRSVSLVPVVYYAHLLAARARQHSRSGDASTAGKTSTESGEVFVPVKDQLKTCMYYV